MKHLNSLNFRVNCCDKLKFKYWSRIDLKSEKRFTAVITKRGWRILFSACAASLLFQVSKAAATIAINAQNP